MLSQTQLDQVTAPLSKARTLPPDAYRLPEVFARECETIFYKQWICVAREEQINEPGQYVQVDLVQQPILVVRQNDGGIRAMSAICPHRAMQITSGQGRTMQFQCPYHLWKFGLDG